MILYCVCMYFCTDEYVVAVFWTQNYRRNDNVEQWYIM